MQQIYSSSMPAKEAALFIGSKLKEKQGTEVLLLLSGGSALQVLEHINTDYVSNQLAVAMVDDRFTQEPEGNNWLQFSTTHLYKKLEGSGAALISSTPRTTDTVVDLQNRLQASFTEILSDKKPYVIALFGIGNDCHTASIFPTDPEEYPKRYGVKELCTSVHEPSHEYPDRVTITPHFISEYIDTAVIFAEKKQEMLMQAQHATDVCRCPAVQILQHKDSHLFTDAELFRS